jgi:competence protein ComEA
MAGELDPLDVPVPARPVALPVRARAGERLREWWEDPRVRTAALLGAAALAGLAWFQIGRGSEPRPSGAAGGPAGAAAPARPSAPPAASTTTPAGEEVLVHVAGAVARPGVVRVRPGARVVDAIAAAGGGLPDAALDQLNLAAKVTDGQRIGVARVGQPAPPVVDGAAPAGGAAAGAAPGAPVDLNAATQAQLEELPGIGPALATAILRYREEHGGFRSVGELQEVRGIGDARFAELEGLVTV